MDGLRTDLRFAVRALLSRPGFTLLAVLTLALGIGVNAVAFSAVNGLLFKTRRFPGVESLGWIFFRSPGNPNAQVSWPDYRDIASGNRTFEAITAAGRLPLSLKEDGGARQVWALLISANYLENLRVRPRIGRIFTAADLAAGDVPAMVSERFWQD